jgi:hypothetical protein
MTKTKAQKLKKFNQYDLSGSYGIGYCSNTNNPFYFDLEDYDLIKDYCWMEVVYGKSNYQKEDAIKARLAAELKYYGDFAPQRHLFKEYNIIQKEGT